jgi:hypothetical protein
MFTPGIEALSRLGSQASGVEILNAISDASNRPRFTHFTHEGLLTTDSVAAKVPVEVWTRIGGFITSPADLVTLGSVSPQAMSAAVDLTRYPWVWEFRLVDVISSGPVEPIPETTEYTDVKDIRRYFYKLGRAIFTAVRGGRRIKVVLGQGYIEGYPDRLKIAFDEVQTYLSGPVVLRKNWLYGLELDDDNTTS